jgi:hypothetical protein
LSSRTAFQADEGSALPSSAVIPVEQKQIPRFARNDNSNKL